MKKKKDKELEIRKIGISPLPEEERRRALFEVFDILFSKKNLPKPKNGEPKKN